MGQRLPWWLSGKESTCRRQRFDPWARKIPHATKSSLLLMLSRFSLVRLCAAPGGRQPTRLPRPWDSPGKNTGVGCHFLLQCMKLKSESGVAQSCLTLSDPMDCSPPGSSVHGIFQARVLEWGAIALGYKCYSSSYRLQTRRHWNISRDIRPGAKFDGLKVF